MGKNISKYSDAQLSQAITSTIHDYHEATSATKKDQLQQTYTQYLEEISTHRLSQPNHESLVAIWSSEVKGFNGPALHYLVHTNNATWLTFTLEHFIAQYGTLRSITNQSNQHLLDYAKAADKTYSVKLLEVFEVGKQLEDYFLGLHLQVQEEQQGSSHTSSRTTITMDVEYLSLLEQLIDTNNQFWIHRIRTIARPVPFLWSRMFQTNDKKIYQSACKCFRILRSTKEDFEGIGLERLEDIHMKEEEMLSLWIVIREVIMTPICSTGYEKVLEDYVIRSGIYLLLAKQILRITIEGQTTPWSANVIEQLNALLHATTSRRLTLTLHQLEGNSFISAMVQLLFKNSHHPLYPKIMTIVTTIYNGIDDETSQWYDQELAKVITKGLPSTTEMPNDEERLATIATTLQVLQALLYQSNFRNKIFSNNSILLLVRDRLREYSLLSNHTIIEGCMKVFHQFTSAHYANSSPIKVMHVIKKFIELEVLWDVKQALKTHFRQVMVYGLNILTVAVQQQYDADVKRSLLDLQLDSFCEELIVDHQNSPSKVESIQKLQKAVKDNA